MTTSLSCPSCHQPLRLPTHADPAPLRCPGCQAEVPQTTQAVREAVPPWTPPPEDRPRSRPFLQQGLKRRVRARRPQDDDPEEGPVVALPLAERRAYYGYAYSRIRFAATLLYLLGVLSSLSGLVLLAFNFTGATASWGARYTTGPRITRWDQFELLLLTEPGVHHALAGCAFFWGVILILGARKALRLEGRRGVVFASVLALFPLSPYVLVAAPCGLSLLNTLTDDEVRRAFDRVALRP